MENRAGTIETGWTWSGGNSSTKDTWAEIWGDGAGAAVKDDAAVVILLNFASKIYEAKFWELKITNKLWVTP